MTSLIAIRVSRLIDSGKYYDQRISFACLTHTMKYLQSILYNHGYAGLIMLAIPPGWNEQKIMQLLLMIEPVPLEIS